MKIIDVTQGSEEWIQARLGIPTASQFSRIMTQKTMKASSSSDKYLNELVAESLLGESIGPEPTVWMERGQELELDAVKFYEFRQDVDTEVVGFCLTEDEKVGYSPDRFIGADGILEVKCPSAANHVGYLLNGLTAEYKAQVQGGLWITGRKWVDTMSFNPELPPVIVRSERDETFISILSALVAAFVLRLEDAKLKVRHLKAA